VKSALGSLRRRILTPPMSQTSVAVRGFHPKTPEAKDRLESVGRSFLTGYAFAAEASRARDAEAPLSTVSASYRGFAYEGAGMALAEFLEGEADKHIYMVYVGVGWAMARVPRFRWSVMHTPDPLLRWLALDGFGFHQAYFKTARYVHQHFQEERFPWPADGPAWYPNKVIDQGIGRASWFVGGTDPDVVAGLLTAFPEHRHPDLWAGAGLAATYAGGAERDDLERFWELAGEHRSQVAQGAAFAAAARVRADLVMPHNELATDVFCGMSAAAATKITDEALVDLPPDGELPAFAVWRSRISDAFATLGRR